MFKQYEIYKSLFEEQKGTMITVAEKCYDEIYNTSYKITNKETIENLVNEKIKPHLNGDEIERNNILSYFKQSIKQFKDDIFSRQIVFTPKYQENEKIAAVDFATAAETVADGERRAQIKKLKDSNNQES